MKMHYLAGALLILSLIWSSLQAVATYRIRILFPVVREYLDELHSKTAAEGVSFSWLAQVEKIKKDFTFVELTYGSRWLVWLALEDLTILYEEAGKVYLYVESEIDSWKGSQVESVKLFAALPRMLTRAKRIARARARTERLALLERAHGLYKELQQERSGGSPDWNRIYNRLEMIRGFITGNARTVQSLEEYFAEQSVQLIPDT